MYIDYGLVELGNGWEVAQLTRLTRVNMRQKRSHETVSEKLRATFALHYLYGDNWVFFVEV